MWFDSTVSRRTENVDAKGMLDQRKDDRAASFFKMTQPSYYTQVIEFDEFGVLSTGQISGQT